MAQRDPESEPPSRASDPIELKVADIFTLFGEVGFRLEFIANERFAEDDSTETDDYRFRERVRLRFGGDITPSKWFTAGFRFSTGSSDYPASGWSSFSDQFRRDPVSLDRVYVILNAGRFHLTAGADANPLFRPTELVWDDDVQVGGLSQVFTAGRWRFAAGQYMLNEVNSLNDPEESGSFLLASNITYTPPVAGNMTLGVFHYFYNKPDALAAAIDDGRLNADFKTNRLEPLNPRAFFSGYNSLGGSFAWIRGKWRFVVEVVVNLSTNQDPSLGPAYAEKEAIGFGGLVRYGVLNEPGDMSFEAGFFHIEADATIAAFNSDDLQQTNVNSIPIWLRIRLPGQTNLVWDTYFQKRINTALFLAGGALHDENALKVRTRLTLSLGF